MLERITEDQLQRICDATIDTLYAYVSRRCGGQCELAEDVTQEVWLRASASLAMTETYGFAAGDLAPKALTILLVHLIPGVSWKGRQ